MVRYPLTAVDEHFPQRGARLLTTCEDLDDGATDQSLSGCDWYNSYQHVCGTNDDTDFDSMVMCCACGGGSTAGQTCEDTDGFFVNLAG